MGDHHFCRRPASVSIKSAHISPVAMKVLTKCIHFSNHKINWSKSVALNNLINLDEATISQLRQNFSFSWATTLFKYLGVQIPANSNKA